MTAEDASVPLVSVVVPTYHRNDQLEAALDSVADQTHDAIEVVVVDGSASRTAESVAADYDARYIHQGEDGGAHTARSMGAQVAEGDYVNFLDDDDRFRPEKLERQLAVHEHEETAGVVYCGIEWENGHPVLPDPDVQGDVLEQALMFHMTPSSPSTMLIDATVLGEILPLSNRHGADDMGMKIELAQRCAFEYVDAPLVVKGDSEESLGGSPENIDGRRRLLEKYESLYDEFPDEVRKTALGHTYLLDAEIELERHLWSAAAIKKAALACYHVPDLPVSFAGYLLASVFGRPGRDAAQRVYTRLFIGSEHRGKLT